jgi:hypothetical protein
MKSKEIVIPVTLRQSKGKFAFLLAVTLMFTAAGVMMATVPQSLAVGLGVAIFFGLCSAVLVVPLTPNGGYLKLEEDGFTFRSLFRVQTFRWADIVSFSLIRIRWQRFVVWRSTDERRGKGAMQKLNDAFGGYDGMLPDTYGTKAKVLAECMQKARDEWVARNQNQL